MPKTEPTVARSTRMPLPAAALGGRRSVEIAIAALGQCVDIRSDGPDQEHVARLAETAEPLPPILVRRSDMRVIDGMHRVLAAILSGRSTIQAEFFDGDQDEAFLRAVQANTAHGLPLSRQDRQAAAGRIITMFPQMSDRAIARASGLGAKAVAGIRRDLVGPVAQPAARVGADGRVRPLSSVESRWRAAELIAQMPEASLRDVARLTGLSPTTVSDVRKRVLAGRPPASTAPRQKASVPAVRLATASVPPARTPAPAETLRRDGDPVRGRPGVGPAVKPDPVTVLERLLRDPSLRLKEEGRLLLRLLQQNATVEWEQLTAVVPSHARNIVGSLARQYAESWLEFAEVLGT
ncbi:ParB/RepB/Spo0J family partition protein [Catenulispora yoronensis]